MNKLTFADFRNRHDGETIVVCGCGTSLKLMERPERCVTIGVNDVGRLFTPDYLVVVNHPRQFSGDRFSYVAQTRAKAIFTQLDLPIDRVVRFRLGNRGGTGRTGHDCLNYTSNSTYVAVDLARHLGARRIGLLGVDFTDDHFFGATGRHRLTGQLTEIDREYAALAAAYQAEGVELVNLSPTSRLISLRRKSLEEFLETTRVVANQTADVTASGPQRRAFNDCLAGPRAPPVDGPRVFFVHYRFLSCGDVFTNGLHHAAEQIGVQSQHAKWDDPDLPDRISRFMPDLLFVVHGRNFVRRWGTRFGAYRSAVWLLDEPYEVDDASTYSRGFDFVFVNDPITISRYPRAHYLPVCFDPRLHFIGNAKRRYHVGFVGGGNPSREALLAELAGRGWLDYVVGGPWRNSRLKTLCLGLNYSPEQTADLYRETAIVLNVFRDRHHFNWAGLAATSMNPRIYEALACGALVASEWRPEIKKRIPALPTFSNLDEACVAIEHALSDPTARKQRWSECFASLPRDTYADRLRTALGVVFGPPGSVTHPVRNVVPAAAISCSGEHNVEDTVSAEDTICEFDEEWDDLGGFASRDGAGEIIVDAPASVHAGAERGLAGRFRYDAVSLEFEVWITAQAIFVAKVHQQDRVDQLANSYHVLCNAQHAYVARHNHIFGMIPVAREAWQRVCLTYVSGRVSVHVGGRLVHQFQDGILDNGYVFVGAKGGRVRLRNVRVSEPAKEGRTRGTDETRAVQPHGAGIAGISYCIAVLRPIYAKLLIEELIKKTSASYEILVWLNLADAEFQAFLDALIRDGHPLRIIGQSPENVGMRAYRMLFNAAKYEMITQVDDDVLRISPRIAERAAAIFKAHPKVRQLVADTWQDEFTTGARPPIEVYHPFSPDNGLYDGPVDGWFSIYHRSILPHLLAMPYSPYFYLGGMVKQRLAAVGLQGLLCTQMKVFHATGPEYASYFEMLDSEISKYCRLGRHEIVKWYEEGSTKLPSRAALDEGFGKISASLSTTGPW